MNLLEKLSGGAIAASIILSSTMAFAGNESSGGGDWFVRTLPLLKVQLPEDFGAVEGVQYKKIGLRKCNSQDLARLEVKSNIPDTVNVINLPDRNWNIFQVMTEGGKNLLCSLGQVDNNPSTSLKTLVDNDDTNRVLYMDDPELGHQIKYSKSQGIVSKVSFSTFAIGTFLTNLDPRGIYFGYNLQDGLRILGFPHSLAFKPVEAPQDFVYIPLSIEDHSRVYFVQTVIDNSANPVWRVVIPVAFTPEDLPLAALAQELRDFKNTSLLSVFYRVKFDPFVDPKITKFQAWTSANQTPTSQSLRKKLIQKFGVSEVAAMSDPDLLKPIFNVTYLPSIQGGKLNHAAFRHGDIGGEITLPMVTQPWRIGADVVHELTHALQTPCGSRCSDDRLFEMEMEAHTNERQHLKEMIEMIPVAKYADDAFNYLVAASLPKVEWASQIQKPLQRSLCEDVILDYGLNVEKILPSTMKKFNCQLQATSMNATSGRIK